eukprot:2294557-Alexandrium_andersonii.AAC.1
MCSCERSANGAQAVALTCGRKKAQRHASQHNLRCERRANGVRTGGPRTGMDLFSHSERTE